MDAIKELCALRSDLAALADRIEPMYAQSGADIRALGERLDKLLQPGCVSIEALNPVFDTDGGGRGYLTVMDIAYNAFLQGRNGTPQDREADRCDWFNDTRPMVLAGVEKIQRECAQRTERVQEEERRRTARAAQTAQRVAA